MTNVSLKTITAALILDSKGQRLYAKYFSSEVYTTAAQQADFEAKLFKKIYKQNQDVILYDSHLVTYKQLNDILVVLVAALSENESLIFSLNSNLLDAFNILLENTVDEQTILEKYDLIALAIDEAIDDGIILEIDPSIIVSRVTDSRSGAGALNDLNTVKIDLSERGIFNALSFASKKIGERLQQGL